MHKSLVRVVSLVRDVVIIYAIARFCVDLTDDIQNNAERENGAEGSGREG